jgi:MerR family redox-sensitive transcriptional activator SoxR
MMNTSKARESRFSVSARGFVRVTACKLECSLSQAPPDLPASAQETVVAGLRIGEVARQAGLTTSALRYYEKAGLLPQPARSSKQRQYDRKILGRIRIILLARDAGFTVSETRAFLNDFPAGATPALRWRTMAERKLAELDVLMARLAQMKLILNASFHCECPQLEDCERLAAAEKDLLKWAPTPGSASKPALPLARRKGAPRRG